MVFKGDTLRKSDTLNFFNSLKMPYADILLPGLRRRKDRHVRHR